MSGEVIREYPVTLAEVWDALSEAQQAELGALAREAETPAERRGALRCFMRFAGLCVEYEYQVTARGLAVATGRATEGAAVVSAPRG